VLPHAASADPIPALEQDPGVEPFAGRTVLLVEDDLAFAWRRSGC
jgi:hypothetical protein